MNQAQANLGPAFRAPRVIVANSPDQALVDGLYWLKVAGEINDSRNGRVLVAPAPVITTYSHPRQRVIMNAKRDANPFFHLFESLWMLAGRNEVAMVSNFAKQMEAFADDGLQWGAYGYRWRKHFGFDQLLEVIDQLRSDPKTRRAVVTMWGPVGDMIPGVAGIGGKTAKDVPCNTQIYFDGTRGHLDMTVLNRSNDVVWGAYGANVVHMSMLHEFVAGAIRMPLGVYHQFSNNYHAYIDRPDVQRLIDTSTHSRDGWSVKIVDDSVYDIEVSPYPIISHIDDPLEWLRQCEAFVTDPLGESNDFTLPFFSEVAVPMMRLHARYKAGDDIQTLWEDCPEIAAQDWVWACQTWFDNRGKARAAKAAAK